VIPVLVYCPSEFIGLKFGVLSAGICDLGSITIARSNDWRGRIDTLERSSTTLVDYDYVGSRVAKRDYGVPDIDYQPTYDNLGRLTEMDYGASIVNFDYTYVDDENNIYRKTFDHRTGDPYNQYSYDALDRLESIYYHDYDYEYFNMDALGNRTGSQTLRDGTVSFTVDSSTNRYTGIGGNNIYHDDAGNMILDKDSYVYYYDYENRIVKIKDQFNNDVAEMDYDALGRRIRVIDKSANPDVTTLYYYNPQWQVLAEYNGSNQLQRYFIYGNYIDEPLIMHRESDSEDYYYAHDHLYSVVALLEADGDVTERYEYDAYGKATIYTDHGGDNDWFDGDETTAAYSDIGNPYLFTGRRLDVLDSGNLPLMYYRIRTYDTYAARFLQQDPIGYGDGMNLYQYVGSNPQLESDPLGLFSLLPIKIPLLLPWPIPIPLPPDDPPDLLPPPWIEPLPGGPVEPGSSPFSASSYNHKNCGWIKSKVPLFWDEVRETVEGFWPTDVPIFTEFALWPKKFDNPNVEFGNACHCYWKQKKLYLYKCCGKITDEKAVAINNKERRTDGHLELPKRDRCDCWKKPPDGRPPKPPTIGKKPFWQF